MSSGNPQLPVRFPDIPNRLGLGVGLDMPWGSPDGFTVLPQDGVSSTVTSYVNRYQSDFNYYFFSFQPKNRAIPRPGNYFQAYDSLVKSWPQYSTRALHHTQLNLGSLNKKRDLKGLAEFTNVLIRRYGFKWVNEDLGIWNIMGKILPYPLPPYLTEEGLSACIENTRFFQDTLEAPLLIEFPGFSEGVSIVLGELDAFDYFSKVAKETGSPVTLDTGHVLAYQWMKARKGKALFEGLEQLPLENCFEIHLSGCRIVDDKFLDLHHGVLLDEQLILLDYLLEHCPNVKAVTYEDPKFTPQGNLIPQAIPNYLKLKERVKQWMDAEALSGISMTRSIAAQA